MSDKIALGWTREEIVDRFARIIRNEMAPEFWEAPPPEWATRAAETIWQNVEAITADQLREIKERQPKRLDYLAAGWRELPGGLRSHYFRYGHGFPACGRRDVTRSHSIERNDSTLMKCFNCFHTFEKEKK